MTNNVYFVRLLTFGLMLWGAWATPTVWAEPNAITGFTEIKSSPHYAPYDRELFSLVVNRKNVIDDKNYFQKSFAATFNALLSQSDSAPSKQNLSQLKKRLLSGPAAKPQAFNENATGKKYFYYEACQAHACDETKLGLLYETRSKAMVARLSVKGKEEFLGRFSESEKNLLLSLGAPAAKGKRQ